MGLRERQKSQRREQILEAARCLLRSTGSTDFSMRQLADEAQVSLVTPYNLFGSKSGVLYALYNSSLERLGTRTDEIDVVDTTGEDILSLAGIAAADYADDARFFRPLLRYLLGVPDMEHRPYLIARSLERWTRNVEAARRDGMLVPPVDVDILARQLLITLTGTVELWLHEELDNEDFVAQSLYGSAALVYAYASDAARPLVLERMRSLERRLPRALVMPCQERAEEPKTRATTN